MDTMTHWASDKALARSHPEISEEFLAKNPKAFRTIEQLLMEAVWRQGKPAEQIKASMKLFCN